jgi:hypothetical protein
MRQEVDRVKWKRDVERRNGEKKVDIILSMQKMFYPGL